MNHKLHLLILHNRWLEEQDKNNQVLVKLWMIKIMHRMLELLFNINKTNLSVVTMTHLLQAYLEV